MKNIVETVNVCGESEDNGDKWTIEKRRPCLHTVTIPPTKTCTTSASSDPLRVTVIEDDPTARVLREGTVSDDVTLVITKGAESVWTVAGEMAKVVTKRTVVVHAMVLRVARGMLATIGTFVLQTINAKMPCVVTVKTNSLDSH